MPLRPTRARYVDKGTGQNPVLHPLGPTGGCSLIPVTFKYMLINVHVPVYLFCGCSSNLICPAHGKALLLCPCVLALRIGLPHLRRHLPLQLLPPRLQLRSQVANHHANLLTGASNLRRTTKKNKKNYGYRHMWVSVRTSRRACSTVLPAADAGSIYLSLAVR